ncbi:hypothetical protein ASC95_05595 [Pelomonas sp. Root1217]|uniref:CheR family methyltransferase n=1 Tax=Pelomonas sp. Root1217 TaxID=1736430 RepID=UPI000714E0D3|nr:protein-glutamate O-methyltransferase CheR [Pelomonas sp. Root1217]KQV60896.1 hypothetical protein ASC95_05595 [Pelomonas sp. Root1217]
MALQELREPTYVRLAELMHGSVGLSFSVAKKPLVASRLAPRLQRLGLDSYDAYVDLISGTNDAGEFQMAVDLLTTNETYFFREPAHFDLLEAELGRLRPQRLRLWSAASSFGDEAYSLAMLLADLQQAGRIGADWSLLGTDISERVLHSAVGAVYPEDRLRHVTPERLRRYCLRGTEGSAGLVQMQARLRERVAFGQLNLCRPIEALGPFDAVFLRNVLIYFDAPTKQAVVERVLSQLRPGGLFFIGTAEGRVSGVAGLEVLAPGAFRKAAA